MANQQDKFNQPERMVNPDNCPYIGIKGEQGSFFGYASPSNCCFKVNTPERIEPSHQEKFCLTANYHGCEAFKASGIESLPPSIRRQQQGRKSWQDKPWVRYGLAGIIAMVIILVFLYLIFRKPLYGKESSGIVVTPVNTLPASSVPTSLPTETPLIETESFILGLFKEGTPSPSLTPSTTPTPSISPTITPTFTPEITPGPGFETPFGPNSSYLIHVVAEGENYPKIAQTYDTSVEVLQAVNILPEGIGLRAGLIIVVLPGIKNPEGVPGFVVVLVDKPMTVQELAQVYLSSPDDIQQYNQVDPNKPIPVGSWIIIPYPNP